jgi:DNA-binding response OmpR family regulator
MIELKSKTIMIVDDASEMIEILNVVIRSAGHRCIVARSGRRCVELIPEVLPDLVLLDIQMPELDGYETCRQIRMLPTGKTVPIIFCTARKTIEDVKEGIKVGGNDFLTKPFDAKSLLARVDRWLTKAPMRVG